MTVSVVDTLEGKGNGRGRGSEAGTLNPCQAEGRMWNIFKDDRDH